ncbi:hypothetical protein HK100_001021, partial [Physocladia obscura]
MSVVVSANQIPSGKHTICIDIMQALLGGKESSKCGYCHSPDEKSITSGVWAYHLHPTAYQALIDRGWRRSGHYLYKPSIGETCCPAYTIRLDSQ